MHSIRACAGPLHGLRRALNRLAGTVLLVGNVWAMTGGQAGSLTLAIGAITAMLWVSAVAARLVRA